jgi:thymidylate kinase
MQHFLDKIGFQLEPLAQHSEKLYFIANRNGEPRWIWNASNPNPDFLRFYAAINWKSKLFDLVVKFIFQIKLQHLIFAKNRILVYRNDAHELNRITQGDFALFTGTEGPNRKLVVFSNDQFAKIALGEKSTYLIQKEVEQLQKIKSGVHYLVPEVAESSMVHARLSDVAKNGERKTEFSAFHAKALQELAAQFPATLSSFKNTKTFQQALKNLDYANNSSAELLPKFLLEKLKQIGDSLQNDELVLTWSHGDFTPWNTLQVDQRISIYDFELAQSAMPFGFDAFHFVMQQAILVDRKDWNSIKPDLEKAYELMALENDGKNTHFDLYLRAYLFTNISFYMRIYAEQKEWHEQISWLIATWNAALSDLLSVSNAARTLVIGDLFDQLNGLPYAAVKLAQRNPQNISTYSDIDLLIAKKDADLVLQSLKKHPLVRKIKTETSSKMSSLMILLINGEVLSIDLIWKLKRNAIEFMDVAAAIEASERNEFGIMELNHENTRNFISRFYALNKATIPTKYLALFTSEELKDFSFQSIQNQVKAFGVNRGIQGLLNKIEYLLDLVKLTFKRSGIIITFSGVDGAGKSTIIEHTKELIEKKFRKRVVVLRHRPSLLPILSAITHGKEQAELKAASNLPRKGNNKSVLGSLLRFSYYYFDYLFGQVYVYFKYVRRGDVVLYDRYYFDFINDGVRSNIRLPKWLTKAGYKLVISPQLNFFLYADAETILSRKKELDAATITQLTQDYLLLFSELGAKSKNQYHPVKNVILGDSLQYIELQTQLKLF